MKRNIHALIRKNRLMSYLVILALGVLCTAVGALAFGREDFWYNFFIGLGCSIIATEIVALLLFSLIPSVDDNNPDWMPVKSYSDRSSTKLGDKNMPTKNLDFLAFGLSNFRSDNHNIESLKTRINNGLKIRILTIDPNSYFLQAYKLFENNQHIDDEINELKKFVEETNQDIEDAHKIEIRYYNSFPFMHYRRADDQICIGPYLPGKRSDTVITHQYEISMEAGRMYSDVFEKMWDGRTPAHIVHNQIQPAYSMDIKKPIEETLKVFCSLLKQENNHAVIGILVLFKDDRRRTFCSYGKPGDEHNNCYQKEKGAVGLMVKNNKSGDCLVDIINDYNNKLAFSFREQRHIVIKKMEATEDRLSPDEETSLIMVLPIKQDGKDDIIGALTFDFADLPKDYSSKINDFKQVKLGAHLTGDNEKLLSRLFKQAEDCKKIITQMISHTYDDTLKSFLEEEWEVR